MRAGLEASTVRPAPHEATSYSVDPKSRVQAADGACDSPTGAATATAAGVATGATAEGSAGYAQRSRGGLVRLSGERGVRVLAGQGVLEAAHAGSQRFAHLGESLGSEHEQQQDQQKGDVDWIVKTHL